VAESVAVPQFACFLKVQVPAPLRTARGIVKQNGVRGLYRGLGVTVLEIMPYAALQFGLFDAFNKACDRARVSGGCCVVPSDPGRSIKLLGMLFGTAVVCLSVSADHRCLAQPADLAASVPAPAADKNGSCTC
jgi:hypothetical protein